MEKLNFLNTVKGSLLEGFYPKGWDLEKMDKCCDLGIKKIVSRSGHWDKGFQAIALSSLDELEYGMGVEIAREIIDAHENGQKLALILPVGPMGMYKHVVEIIEERQISCAHVYTFNMDEWSNRDGDTMPSNQDGAFELAMSKALFDPLGPLTVPKAQRHFATKEVLPKYEEKINSIKEGGGRLVTVYGIGRACHIAFWEPQIGDEYTNDQEWKTQAYRIGQPLHPLTIEQNSLHSFSSRFTLIPCFANTIGPGLYLKSDFCIGGADGVYPNRGANWQGMSLCVTLQYGPSRWVPSSWMPTLPGKLFFMKELAGPLLPEAH